MSKITVRITQEQQEAMKRKVPWGLQERLFGLFAQAILEAVETRGDDVLYDIINGDVKISIG